MSWSQRLSQLSGRWSPFTKSPTTEHSPTKVSDADFSYITSEDLNNGDYDDKSDTNRETDILIIKNKRNAFQIHFPVHSIDRGELTIAHVKEQAAKKLDADAKRLKLLYRGKTLKDESRNCREEGLIHNAEIMCVYGDSSPSPDSSSDSEEGSEQAEGEANKSDQVKRKRNRNRNKKKKGKKRNDSIDSRGLANTDSMPPSRTATPKPQIPVTAQEKLEMLYQTLQSFIPQIDAYRSNPPEDIIKREYEHKRLSETILQQVLLKLDAVETDDVNARARRKEIVKQTQQVLTNLDTAINNK